MSCNGGPGWIRTSDLTVISRAVGRAPSGQTPEGRFDTHQPRKSGALRLDELLELGVVH